LYKLDPNTFATIGFKPLKQTAYLISAPSRYPLNQKLKISRSASVPFFKSRWQFANNMHNTRNKEWLNNASSFLTSILSHIYNKSMTHPTFLTNQYQPKKMMKSMCSSVTQNACFNRKSVNHSLREHNRNEWLLLHNLINNTQ